MAANIGKNMIALKGTLITPLEMVRDGVVVISGNRIGAVGAMNRVRIPACANVIDCRGKFVSPGFIDLHVQGAGGCDVLDGTYDAINTIAKTLARNGTTAFLATTVVNTKIKKQPHGQPP